MTTTDPIGSLFAEFYDRCDDLMVSAHMDQWWRVTAKAWVGNRQIVAIAHSSGPLDPLTAFGAAARSLDRQLSAVSA